MKINRATDYGVRLMVYLAGCPEKVVSRAEASRKLAIPAEFLAKIAQTLARAGFIEIRQGRTGGYRLTKDPAKVTLLEVVEALEGDLLLNVCVTRPEACQFSTRCKVHLVWEAARKGLRDLLDSIYLTDLVLESENKTEK